MTNDNLEDTIYRIVREDILDVGAEFTRDTSLLEAGLDSLSLTQLLLAIEEETGVWIDESHLTKEHLQNVKTLTACVRDIAKDDSGENATDDKGGDLEQEN